MIEVIFLVVLAGIWILFASVSDLKKREVANWLSFSLIIFAMGFRFFYSLFFSDGLSFENFQFFYQGLIGLGIFFILGNAFYYGRVFAGGDAKLLIALGAILPFYNNLFDNLIVFATFLILFLFSGMIYGLLWSLFLCLRHFNDFKKSYKKLFLKYKKIFYVSLIIGLLFILTGFLEVIFFSYGLFLIIIPLLYFYAKAIDEASMIKEVEVSDLTEGDWLYKEIKLGNKKLKPNWEGLNKKDIEQIKKEYKMVKIRQGIPYIPVFLISFFILIILFFSGKLFFIQNFFL